MDSSSSNTKRQKITSDDAGLLSLPDGVLASVGEYLALPSRALFAAALAAPSSSWGERHWTGEASAAVQAVMPLGTFGVLDFSEVEKELAMRLSDDDLGMMLACLDAAHTLHTLKLANCLNVTGRGLQPLRGSTALQFIDLTLVGQFESPEIEGGALSASIVAPILQSIIDAEGTALKYLALPHKWKAEESEVLTQFHRNYASYLYGKSHPCAGGNCGNVSGPSRSRRCPVCSEQPCQCTDFGWFYRRRGGSQRYTCCLCGAMYCEDCCYGENMDQMDSCDTCLRGHCVKCVPTAWCDFCDTNNCSGCRSTGVCSQPQCDNVCCSECAPEFMETCDVCGEETCDVHWQQGEDLINTCSDCNRTRCSTCCEIQHCNSYECGSVMCNDCQPEVEGWECLWCKEDDYSYHSFFDRDERPGPRCTGCFERAKTHCHRCRKKKLWDEDYLAPSIPSSYWTSRGHDEAYVEKMESFLQEMKVLTLKLKSGEKVDCGIFLGGWCSNGLILRHDDILLPRWQELADALGQYGHGSEPHDEFSLWNIELHSSVLDMLRLALQEKNFRALRVENVASSTNGIKLAIDYAQSNPKLAHLVLEGTPVDEVESLRELFDAIADHPLLNSISFKSMCGETMNGHDLLPLAFSLLHATNVPDFIATTNALFHGTKSYKLDLSSNNIRTNGATDLPDFIASNNPRLKELLLYDNGLDDSDALLIAEALKRNNTLKRISLGGNDITEIGRDALGAVVFDSSSVRSVVNSNHSCSIDLVVASALGDVCYSSNEESKQAKKMRLKIYRLFSFRNVEGSNGHLLGLELGDNARKLAPNVFELVMNIVMNIYPHGDWKYYSKVPPLSVVYEFVRSWKLPCLEDSVEIRNGGA